VFDGNGNREAALHFRVSYRFADNMMILQPASGCLAAAKRCVEVHRGTVGGFTG